MVMGIAPVLVIFGAIYHWFPKMTGRMLHEGWGQFHFWVSFLGSYLVDFFHVQGYLRWTLILILMMMKAGLIVAVFMHIKWERMALSFAILIPPVLLLVLIGIMTIESDYTFLTRGVFFGSGS